MERLKRSGRLVMEPHPLRRRSGQAGVFVLVFGLVAQATGACPRVWRPGACLRLDSAAHATPPSVCGPGPPFSLGDLLQNGHVQSLVCHLLLQASVLLFKFLEPLECIFLHAPILAFPTLVGSHAQRNDSAGFLQGLAAS
jgi:hypothetical protein